MEIFNFVVPLVSVFVGALITYYANIRQRQRNYVSDLFNHAIAAVSAAATSVDYLADVGRPKHLSDEEFQDLQKWLVTEGMKNWVTRVAEANDALARTLPFQPAVTQLLPYSPDASNRDAAREAIQLLRQGPVR